jgi:hypothetical protein
VQKQYQSTCSSFGLTISTEKTKHRVTGRLAVESDRDPIPVTGGELASVDEFTYLGSVVSSSASINTDVSNRISRASKAFGALRKAVFLDKNLTLQTKKMAYMKLVCCQCCCMVQSVGYH